MAIEFNGKSIETNPGGYLINHEDWSKELGEVIAKEEGLELTEKHWDLINYLRDEFVNHGGNQPNTRNIVKAMSAKWNEKIGRNCQYT